MESFLLFVAIAGNILLGLFTFLKNRTSDTNKLFLFFTITLSLYIWSNSLISDQTSNEMAFFWIRTVMTLALLINFFFFLLMVTFPSSHKTLSKRNTFILFVSTLMLFPVTMSNLIFSSVQVVPGNVQSTPGIGMPFFLLHTLVCLGGGFFSLFQKLRKSKGAQKKQIRLVFIGAIFMFTAILITNVFFVVFFNVSTFIGLLPVYTLLFVGCVSYAIIRHKLLDINVLVVRTVTYFFVILGIALVYTLTVILFGRLFFEITISQEQQIVLITLTVLIALTFQRIRKIVEKSTNRFLFKDSYNTDEAIGRLTTIMASTILLSDLINKLLPELRNILKFTSGAFILVEKDTYEIKTDKETSDTTVSSEEIQKIRELNATIIFDDLEEGEVKEILRKHNLAVISPCQTQEELIAFLCLGSKSSGDNYTEQDLSLIKIVSDEAAVAIKNAQAYEEIKRFNLTLQDEVQKATKQLTEANTQLQELDKLKDEFVSLASHELRTPMAAIKGSISTILEGYAGDISEQSREFLTAAYNENDRLIRLVNNLLNTSRIESGKMNFNISRIDLTTLITEVVRNLEVGAKEKKLYLTYETPGFLPHVMADEDKIKEVIINLVGNAIKFTSEGGISIRSKIDGDFVVTTVADTGTGIHKEHYELLFKKFSQLKTDYTKTIGGTGLGLYICKKILEGLQGKIWLESEVGKGTIFYFSLPIAK